MPLPTLIGAVAVKMIPVFQDENKLQCTAIQQNSLFFYSDIYRYSIIVNDTCSRAAIINISNHEIFSIQHPSSEFF